MAFNVRVYGILLRGTEVLLSSEQSINLSFIKFPGGGVQLGEGILDALQREFLEECGIQFERAQLFYVNTDFIQSAFQPNDQILSFYFRIHSEENPSLEHQEERFGEIFHVQNIWKDLNNLSEGDFAFPLDKRVIALLKAGINEAR